MVWVPFTVLLAMSLRQQAPAPESRALAFLSREVPRWAKENNCYSCHNNGDAARALYTAARLSLAIPADALADTSRWLSRPQQWDANAGKERGTDTGLARIQFAAALVDALDADHLKERRALAQAAVLVAEKQRPDGSWQVDAEGSIGSPATYGSCLATYQARRVLQKADAKYYRPAISKAERWLRELKVKSVLDAAAVLLALAEGTAAEDLAQQKRCLELIRKGESAKGGWGPYIVSAAEPFDTAIVLLALVRSAPREAKDALRRGRAYLLAMQQADGSWQETTRPAGAESYAQRLSTTGWATLALLATR